MINKFKDVDLITCTTTFSMTWSISEILTQKHQDRWKVIQKYSDLLYWICYDQRLKIRKN